MKVVEFINKLNEIGYDDNTELIFSCIDGLHEEYCEIPLDEILYGGELGHKDIIDICLNIDLCDEYIKDKTDNIIEKLTSDIIGLLTKYKE